MSIKDLIGDYQPSVNADDAFEPIKGKYECLVDKLEVGSNKDGVEDRYKMTLKVTKVISGDKAVNRLLFKSYYKSDEKKMKQFVDDLFTLKVKIDTSLEDHEIEAQFVNAIGVTGFVSAYTFTPDKAMDGTPIPADERKKLQIAKLYQPKAEKKSADSDVAF